MLRYLWPLFPIGYLPQVYLEIEIKGSAMSSEIDNCFVCFVFRWRKRHTCLWFWSIFNHLILCLQFSIFNFFNLFQMEQNTGLFGLDQFTISLICGFSVLSLVLVIVSLGIIGFFIKVGVQPFFLDMQVSLAPTYLVNQLVKHLNLHNLSGWDRQALLRFGRGTVRALVQDWYKTHGPPFRLWCKTGIYPHCPPFTLWCKLWQKNCK